MSLEEGQRARAAYSKRAATYHRHPNRTRDLDAVITRRVPGALRPRTVLELGCGTGFGLAVERLDERWHAEESGEPPRLLSILFRG